MGSRISSCIISLLLLAEFPLFSQAKPGIRVGVDVLQPLMGILLKDRTGGEASIDLRFANNYFVVGEAGFQHSSIDSTVFHYKGNGAFLRIGIDKNLLTNPKFKGNDVVTLGIRYGTSLMTNSASGIVIPTSYWTPVPLVTDIPGHTFMTHWLELKAGIRAEVLRNFFIGWSLSGKVMLGSGHPDGLTPYLVPGFGKGNSNTVFGFNYYFCYVIPFRKSTDGGK